MNRKIFFVILLFVLFFSSCQTSEKTIQSIGIDSISMIEEFVIDEFTISDLTLRIEYSDGTISNINVSENMLSDSDLAKLNTIGNHTIDVFYQGYKVSVDLNIVYANHTLTLMLINIYETGINEGDIEGLSYEEWLASIKGEDGKDGQDGTDGIDGREVEFQSNSTHVQWRYKGESSWNNLISISAITGKSGVDGSNGLTPFVGSNGNWWIGTNDMGIFAGFIDVEDEIISLFEEGEYHQTLKLIIDSEINNIDNFSREDYIKKILEVYVPELYRYYWFSNSVSDVIDYEEEFSFLFQSVSGFEQDLLIHEFLDAQWHKDGYQLNNALLELVVKEQFPLKYDEFRTKNLEMQRNNEVLDANALSDYLDDIAVKIFVYDNFISMNLLSTGSGFFVNDNGLIVTNHHVISVGNTIRVETKYGQRYVAQILKTDEYRDVAILKINVTGNEYATLSNSYYVKTGDTVFAYGSPKGISNTLSQGIISKDVSVLFQKEYIQTTTPISPGSSGGMLVNNLGHVIGVTTSNVTESQNINLAIPINRVITLINEVDVNVEIVIPGSRHMNNITDDTIFNLVYYKFTEYSNSLSLDMLDKAKQSIYQLLASKDGEISQESEMYDNKRNGKGYRVYSDGVYSGEFTNAMRDGFGEFFWDNGDYYIGQYSENIKIEGKYFWGNQFSETFGHLYIGQFTESGRNGYGSYFFPDHAIYIGEHVDGDFTGYGTFYYSNGAYHIGNFLNGYRDGLGIFYDTNDVIHYGFFKEGIPNGEGIRYFSNGYFDAIWTGWNDAVGIYYFYESGNSKNSVLIDGVWQ